MFVSSIKCNYSLWFCLFYFSFWCCLSQWLNSLYRFCPLKGHLTHLTMIFLYIWIISQIYSNVSFSLNLFIACLDKALSSGKLYPSVNSNYCILNGDTNYWNIPPVLPWRGNKTFCSPSCCYSPLHAISWLHSALLRIQHSSWLIPQWLCGECVHRTTDWFWWLWTMPWNGQFPAPTVKDNGSIHQLSSAQNINAMQFIPAKIEKKRSSILLSSSCHCCHVGTALALQFISTKSSWGQPSDTFLLAAVQHLPALSLRHTDFGRFLSTGSAWRQRANPVGLISSSYCSSFTWTGQSWRLCPKPKQHVPSILTKAAHPIKQDALLNHVNGRIKENWRK